VLALILGFAFEKIENEIQLRHDTSTRIYTPCDDVSPMKTLDLDYPASKRFFKLMKSSGDFGCADVCVEFGFHLIACTCVTSGNQALLMN